MLCQLHTWDERYQTKLELRVSMVPTVKVNKTLVSNSYYSPATV